MDSAETVTLTLAPEVAAELREAGAASGLATIGEVVSQAVEEWRASRVLDRPDHTELRRLIQEGADSGPGIPADEVLRDLLAELESKPLA